MNKTVSDSSKLTYRVNTLTHLGAETSYIHNPPLDKDALEYLFGNAAIWGAKMLG